MSVQRRRLRFNTLEEVLADARAQVAGGAAPIGRWSVAQIIEHLALAIDKSIDGFEHRAAWPLRILGRLLFKRMFVHRRMPSGLTLPGRASGEVAPIDGDRAAAIEHLARAIDRLRRDPPRQAHPLLGRLTPAEWTGTHLRHAELHLSFLVVPPQPTALRD